MTGDPNQQTRQSVFGDDYNYPATAATSSTTTSSNPVEWSRFAGNNFYMQSNFPFCSNYGPAPVTFPIHSSSKNGNCFGPIYNYPANTSNTFAAASTSTGTFGALMPPSFCNEKLATMGIKRKANEAMPFPAKQHITEEKMAEHMSKLHISSETPVADENDVELTQRLYMCEEMKKLQTDSILPPALLSRFQRPCTALVLWQPPQRPIAPAPDPNQAENIDNNNEEEVPDQNLMDLI